MPMRERNLQNAQGGWLHFIMSVLPWRKRSQRKLWMIPPEAASVSEAVSVAASLLAAVVVVEEAVPQAVNEAARLSATADLATRRFDLFIVILLLFERFAAHRQLLSVLWCLLLVSESFTITSQVGVKADPQDNSNIYVALHDM